MVNKYERRRRALKESQNRGESPPASPLSSPTTGTQVQLPPWDAGGRRASRGVVFAICCLLVLGTVMVFAQTVRHGFVNCDDDEYVEKNSAVQFGLTPATAWWAITQPHSANWHPLTWISHMIDWQVFGTWDADRQRYVNSWPGGHHLVNLLFHAANAVLLFLILQELSGAIWPSAAVAALFAIHPLRVESVAWVTERKDLLSGLFFLLTLAAYQAYAARPFTWWRYALVIVTFSLGLMAKSMLVTVPLVLLLLDYWPLGRIASPHVGNNARGSFSRLLPPRVIFEKIPLLALSAGSCVMTMWAQSLVAAFKPLDFRFRVGNAVLSYAAYIRQMFFPEGMVVQYVHPGPRLELQDTLAPLLILASITLGVVWLGLRRRYLVVGWPWYVGMLVPVIGLVQVGAQARADRYTYLTQVGLYIMVAWGLRDLFQQWRRRATICGALAVPVIALLASIAWLQTSYWRNSLALWQHAVACQPDNDYAQNLYGQALADAGQVDEAIQHYLRAFDINPLYLAPRINYAATLWKQNKWPEALEACEDAIRVDPNNARAHAMKAAALYSLHKPDESIREFQVAIQINPKDVEAQTNFAKVLLAAKSDLNGALEHFQAALELKPEDPSVCDGLASVLWRQGKFPEALEYRKRQVAFQPQNVVALDHLAAAYAQVGDFAQAEAAIHKAMETPQGQTPNIAVELQKRLALYQARQKPVIAPP
jgi:protein O-mannosyl-transferase